jgi:hypothetical protein
MTTSIQHGRVMRFLLQSSPLLALVAACTLQTHSLPEVPRLSGRLFAYDGDTSHAAPDIEMRLALGGDFRCRQPVYTVRTDSIGQFAIPASAVDTLRGNVTLCVGIIRNGGYPVLTLPVRELHGIQLRCWGHGPASTPACDRLDVAMPDTARSSSNDALQLSDAPSIAVVWLDGTCWWRLVTAYCADRLQLNSGVREPPTSHA